MKKIPELDKEAIAEFMDFVAELHRGDRIRDSIKAGYSEKEAELIEKDREDYLNRIFDNIRKRRAKALEDAFAKGVAEGMAEVEGMTTAIKNYIKNKPKGRKLTAGQIAALFSVDEAMVRPLLNN